MKNKEIEIKITKNENAPRYIVCGDGGHTIYGAFEKFDQAKRLKEQLDKRIEDLEKEKFLMKLKK